MRSIVQSIFARHPIAVAAAAGLRWIAWTIVGHPFGLALVFALAVVGLPSWYWAVALVGLELALAAWGFAGLTNGSRGLYLWSHICRFRRRWPGRFARAYDGHRFFPVGATNYYSVPGGLRPVLVAPQLSFLPLAFSYDTVGWILTPRAEHDLCELRSATGRIAAADDRIACIDVRVVRGGRLALIVTFERVGSGRSGRFTSRLREGGIDGGGGGLDVLGAPPPSPASSPGGTAIYNGEIRGLQRLRLGNLAANRTHEPAGRVAPDVSAGGPSGVVVPLATDWSETVVSQAARRNRSVSKADLPGTRRNRESLARLPLPWSFSVIVPANLLLGTTVLLTDAGLVAVVALCAAAGISIVLIIAEGIGDS